LERDWALKEGLVNLRGSVVVMFPPSRLEDVGTPSNIKVPHMNPPIPVNLWHNQPEFVEREKGV
jgi:hypothetical protein